MTTRALPFILMIVCGIVIGYFTRVLTEGPQRIPIMPDEHMADIRTLDSLRMGIAERDSVIAERDSIIANRTPVYIRVENGKQKLALQPDSVLMRHFLADPGSKH